MTLLEHRTRETLPSTGLFVRGMRLTGHTFKVSKKIHSNRGCSALFPQVARCSWTLVATGAGTLCLRHVWCEGVGLDRHMPGELGTHHDRKLLIWRNVLQNRRRSNTNRRRWRDSTPSRRPRSVLHDWCQCCVHRRRMEMYTKTGELC